MYRWDWSCVSGSFAPYAAEYEAWLVDRGFAPLALPKRMRQLRTAPIRTPPGRYQPPDALLAFLERL